MKKLLKQKSLKICAAAILFYGAALVGYNAYSNATMTPEERLFQQNLEALTDGEQGGLLNQGPAQLVTCNSSSSISIGKYCAGEATGGACVDIPCNNDLGSGGFIYTNY